MNNGVRKFPIATEMDLLSRRLVELGLADKDMLAYDKSSGLIEQVIALTEEGHAAEAVIRMYESWKQQQSVSLPLLCKRSPVQILPGESQQEGRLSPSLRSGALASPADYNLGPQTMTPRPT
eukprot:gene90-90_t